MTINLYNNTSDKKKIGKSLTLVSSLNGSLREECDMINPSVLIEHSGVITANYAAIPDFNRKYFITKITSVRNNLWRVDMHVDVRETYASQIKANEPILERSEFVYNLYLPDNELPLTEDTFTSTYEFGSSFGSTYSFLMIANSEVDS